MFFDILNLKIAMKKYILLTYLFLFSVVLTAQELNGAWKLIEKNGETVDYEMIKLFSDRYFTYAAYEEDSGQFIEAGGGTYMYEFFKYTENYEIDSTDPERSGTSSSYKALLKKDILRVSNIETKTVEVWKKIDEADNKLMATCWRIHEKQDEGDAEWRRIEYAPRKTLKMITNTHYQVLALNSETGKFVGSSGGTWFSDGENYYEHVAFFSKNQDNVGRTLDFHKKIDGELWYHTGLNTKGEIMLEKWLRYK